MLVNCIFADKLVILLGMLLRFLKWRTLSTQPNRGGIG
jgi:hypothetical protein